MKIALYIEDGLEQIVLTPQSDTERGILRKLEDGSRTLSVKRGRFYACQGGWITQGGLNNLGPFRDDPNESTMIVLSETQTDPAQTTTPATPDVPE